VNGNTAAMSRNMPNTIMPRCHAAAGLKHYLAKQLVNGDTGVGSSSLVHGKRPNITIQSKDPKNTTHTGTPLPL
jgi:hypothetical protein